MKLQAWRTAEGRKMTMKELADLLDIGHGTNPSRRVQRIETGEALVDAVLAARIVTVTGGEVTLQDLNDTRREFLAKMTEAAA